jgi:hypothetical protein
MAEVGPGEVLQYIEAITYPATKEELVNTAINHDAPDDVIATLTRLPEKDYEDGNDVSGEIEKLD